MEKTDFPNEYIELTNRFFEALKALKQRDDIRGMGTFIREHEIDKRNFYKVKDFSIRSKLEWLKYLFKNYNVPAQWLLTGKGRMFKNSSN